MNNNEDELLNHLAATWQQHCQRIDLIAQRHDPERIHLAPRLLVFSSRRLSRLADMAMAAICIGAIVAIIVLRQQYILDIFDFLFFILLVAIFASTAVQSLVRAHSSRRLALLALPRPQPSLLLRRAVSRAAVFASVMVMILMLVIPIQNGRATSHASLAQRSATIANVNFVLSQMQQQPTI